MRSPRDLARALTTGRRTGPVGRRWAVVVSAAGSTVTINLDGVVIAGVKRYAHVTGLASPNVVALDVVDGDLVVVGKLA